MKVFCESFGGDRRQSQTRLEFPSPLLLPGYYPQVVRLDTGAVLSAGKDRCFAVPKGQARIAQRFNAGLYAKRSQVPKGRLRPACAAERSGAAGRSNPTPHPSAVPSGLACLAECFPALKRRAILKLSLRDKGMEA